MNHLRLNIYNTNRSVIATSAARPPIALPEIWITINRYQIVSKVVEYHYINLKIWEAPLITYDNKFFYSFSCFFTIKSIKFSEYELLSMITSKCDVKISEFTEDTYRWNNSWDEFHLYNNIYPITRLTGAAIIIHSLSLVSFNPKPFAARCNNLISWDRVPVNSVGSTSYMGTWKTQVLVLEALESLNPR